MKILDIRFKNLNSLRGEWHINLQDNAFVSDGIFAITGPTGAGKTTIFDAICLALYSQTHRLGRITGQSNEIMSKHTKECYAQVVFENRGQKYICSWEQHKAGKSNTLQTPKHVLSDSNGEIISSSISSTVKSVEEITGMDFKRFTQAMMLEQGDFDAFLKAGAGERSKILELITGTDIYGRISTEVFDRTSIEQRKLQEIEQIIALKKPNDNFGTDDEITAELSVFKSEHEKLVSQHEDMRKALQWLDELQKIREEYERNNEEIAQKRQFIIEFEGDRKRLEVALLAQEIMNEYIELREKRKRLSEIREIYENNKQDISVCKIKLANTEKIGELESELKSIRRDVTESHDAIQGRIELLIKNFESIKGEALKSESERTRIQSSLQAAQANLDSAEAEYKAVIDRYEEAVLGKVRSNLKAGEPCPVCGSRDHPAIVHDVLETEAENVKPDFESVSKKLRAAHNEYTRLRTQYDNFTKDLEAKNENADRAKNDLFEALAPLGIFGMKGSGEARERVRNWANSVRTLEDRIKSLSDDTMRLTQKIETLDKVLTDNVNAIKKLKSELEVLEDEFRVKLAERNFDDEDHFRASIISDKEIKELQNRKKYLDNAMNGIKAQRANIISRLEAAESKALTQSTKEELLPVFKDQEARIKDMLERIIAREQAINTRQKLKTELEALNEQHKTQAKIYSEWSALNELIGNRNGNKYRIFAQGVTLSMMIQLANIQLRNMSGRYELTSKAGDDNLELSVIDKEQAGTIRPTSNLSGGERFIISLALALGLSQISGSKARVDSLFLDEGFGSLDEDSLSTALEALGEVRREGRMIGIISHVAALKERIAAQINVIPKHEGTSIIEGPGCTGK